MAFLKTSEEIEIMAEGGRLLARVRDTLAARIRPGVRTKEIDREALRLIREAGAEPAFLHYRPRESKKAYPAIICVSINDAIVHGLPSEYEIQNGDLVKLDLGLKFRGFYLDTACTVAAGTVSAEDKKLIAAAEEALARGISAARPGGAIGDIGAEIEETVKKYGFSVADQLTGHGIGTHLHEDPAVYNRGVRGKGESIVPGMVLAIEPMIVAGGRKTKELQDGSFVSADGSRTAHFEHTVAITKEGPRVLTLS